MLIHQGPSFHRTSPINKLHEVSVIADDVIDSWLGDDVPTDVAKVETWIARAERLIRATFPGDSIYPGGN